MLTRRHIRVKVMQSLYAYSQSKNDSMISEEKFLLKSMNEMYDLYLLLLDLMVEIKHQSEGYLEKSQQKHLPTQEEMDPNRKFVENEVLVKLENHSSLQNALEARKLNNWKNDDGDFKDKTKDIQESMIDRVESALYKQIFELNNLTAIIFYLKLFHNMFCCLVRCLPFLNVI